MTREEREEAIEVLNGIEEVYGTLPEDGNKIDEALSMAIKALEQTELVDGDRAISLNAVLDALEMSYLKSEIDDLTYQRIKKLPPVKQQQEDIAKDGTLTVRVADARKVTRVLVCGDNHWGGLYYPDEDAEPQTGHWILSIEDWNKWTCSECGYSERTDIHVSLGYDYCPKCGTKMVEEHESEDKI